MTKFFVLAPCDQIDLPDNALPPSLGGGRPDQSLPGARPERPDNSLPGQRPERPDNSLPGQGWSRPDQGLPGQGGRPDNSLPGSQPEVDNALPGKDKPVDPEYGVDPKPGQPDQGLPMPQVEFTDEEKRQILRLAEQKFTHTELSPMRCIVQAARWVLVTRRKQDRPTFGAKPDNTLPGQPPVPTQPIQPTPQPTPPSPDQSLPPTPPVPPTTPDQSLPPTAEPKSY